MTTPIIFPDDTSVIRIGRALFDRSLPKPEWTHAAHFAAAIWVIAARPDLVPARDLPSAIRAYNEATGVANTGTGGYHETITQASLLAAADAVSHRREQSLSAICDAVLASPLGRPDWLLEYWSRTALFSVHARRMWLAPDIKELPFQPVSVSLQE